MARDTENGFNSAEVGHLEGRLVAEIGEFSGANLHAPQVDTDETLPQHLLLSLDAFVPTIVAALRIAGLDATSEKEPEPTNSRSRRQAVDGTVADLVAAGLLEPGTKLIFDSRGKKASAAVNAAGEIVLNGVSYWSPSGAAKKVLGGKAANRWKAWRVGKDGPTLNELRYELQGS